ncbi:MAG: LysM peptidoglycan-binding domain-containing protein [Flavonifractor plautii]
MGYSFAFWEGYDGHSTGVQVTGGGGEPETGPAAGTAGERRHTVRRGETLWGIARDYGLSLTELIALNPQIKNPNLILAGEEVRLA